jgi:YfiH family protein
MNFIKPIWPAPENVRAMVTTRHGGLSEAPYDTLNLGDHVGDQLSKVIENRQILQTLLPSEPFWLQQTHGIQVSTPNSRSGDSKNPIEADAAVSNIPAEVLVVMTADCLPVLFSNADGSVIGVAHAGWRGLCNGVLEDTVSEILRLAPQAHTAELMAWMGPAIGPESFEVGEDVLGRFAELGLHDLARCFLPLANKPGKYLADIYQLARDRLKAMGINSIYGGEYCTVKDGEQFFSYRRDGVTGRFASLIWIAK